MSKTHKIQQEFKVTPNSKPTIQRASLCIDEDDILLSISHNNEVLMMDLKSWNQLVKMVELLKLKAKI